MTTMGISCLSAMQSFETGLASATAVISQLSISDLGRAHKLSISMLEHLFQASQNAAEQLQKSPTVSRKSGQPASRVRRNVMPITPGQSPGKRVRNNTLHSTLNLDISAAASVPEDGNLGMDVSNCEGHFLNHSTRVLPVTSLPSLHNVVHGQVQDQSHFSSQDKLHLLKQQHLLEAVSSCDLDENDEEDDNCSTVGIEDKENSNRESVLSSDMGLSTVKSAVSESGTTVCVFRGRIESLWNQGAPAFECPLESVVLGGYRLNAHPASTRLVLYSRCLCLEIPMNMHFPDEAARRHRLVVAYERLITVFVCTSSQSSSLGNNNVSFLLFGMEPERNEIHQVCRQLPPLVEHAEKPLHPKLLLSLSNSTAVEQAFIVLNDFFCSGALSSDSCCKPFKLQPAVGAQLYERFKQPLRDTLSSSTVCSPPQKMEVVQHQFHHSSFPPHSQAQHQFQQAAQHQFHQPRQHIQQQQFQQFQQTQQQQQQQFQQPDHQIARQQFQQSDQHMMQQQQQHFQQQQQQHPLQSHQQFQPSEQQIQHLGGLQPQRQFQQTPEQQIQHHRLQPQQQFQQLQQQVGLEQASQRLLMDPTASSIVSVSSFVKDVTEYNKSLQAAPSISAGGAVVGLLPPMCSTSSMQSHSTMSMPS